MTEAVQRDAGPMPSQKTYTVVGVWEEGEPIPVGVIAGDHEVTGGDEFHWEEGIWAAHAVARDAGKAESLAVAEMLDGLDDKDL